MIAKRIQLGDILQRHGVISDAHLLTALEHQRLHGGRMGEILISLGYCSEVDVARVLAEQMEIPFVDLEQTPPSPCAMGLIPAAVARANMAIPVRIEGNRLLVAAKNPFDIRIDEEFRKASRKSVMVAAAAASQVASALSRYEILRCQPEPLPNPSLQRSEAGMNPAVPGTKWSGERPEVVQMVDAMVAEVVRTGATSFHLEPDPEGMLVRARVDGGLVLLRKLPRQVAESVLARLHVMARIERPAEAGLRQGTCRVRVDGRELELRMTSLPGLLGESLTCRILDPSRVAPLLQSLGLAPQYQRLLQDALGVRQGLILVAGPADGGKTTLLHSLAREAAGRGLQVLALEQEFETLIPGAHQLPLEKDRTLSSMSALGVLSQPDVVMIGSVTDAESAGVACRSAAAGRLVLAGITAQGSLDAIARLLDMGVPPAQLATSLVLVVGQHLVPRVCAGCSEVDQPGAGCRSGRGCEACFQRGTRGRLPVHELLPVDEDLRYLIAERRPPSAIYEHVMSRGFKKFREDLDTKIQQGLVPPAERQVISDRQLALA